MGRETEERQAKDGDCVTAIGHTHDNDKLLRKYEVPVFTIQLLEMIAKERIIKLYELILLQKQKYVVLFPSANILSKGPIPAQRSRLLGLLFALSKPIQCFSEHS